MSADFKAHDDDDDDDEYIVYILDEMSFKQILDRFCQAGCQQRYWYVSSIVKQVFNDMQVTSHCSLQTTHTCMLALRPTQPHGRSLSGARGAKPPYEATYFQAFLDGGYCDNNMLNRWWAFNDKSDMLLTLLTSKKSSIC